MPWSVSSYNTNPALNTLINGTDIGEGSDAAGYNDALRQMMADIAGWVSTGLATLGGLSVAYQRLIINSKSTAFSPAVGESSNAYNFFGAAADMTLQPNASVPLTAGDTFIVRVGGPGALGVKRGAGVNLAKNGSSSSADASIAVGGIATIIYWGSDAWTINGSGVS
jgi:hypothetical protein